MNEREPAILFFDGECNLCNSSVDFVIRRDRDRRLRYAPLGSDTAEAKLPDDLPEKRRTESVILLDQDGVWTHSDAALRVAAKLPAPWRWLSVFRIVPRFLRDAVYRWVARNRYAMFGKRDHCRVPTTEERALFLD